MRERSESVLRQTPVYFLLGGIIAMIFAGLPGSMFNRGYLFYGGLASAIYGLFGLWKDRNSSA